MSDNMQSYLVIALLVFCFGMLLVVSPLFTIWSLNTLFGLGIPLTWKTWAAVVWLITMLHGLKVSVGKDD